MLQQIPESQRAQAHDALAQAWQRLADTRPFSLTERLQEQVNYLKAGALNPLGAATISPGGVAVVQSLLELAILDAKLQPPLPPGNQWRLAPPADYGFTSEVMRLLRLSFPGGINIRHPEQTAAGAGVFEDFSRLEITVGAAAPAIILSPSKEGYRYEVPKGRDGSGDYGVLAPGQTILCGRIGGIPLSIAGVRMRIGPEVIKTDVGLPGQGVSRAAIEIKALKHGGIIVVDRGSQNTVGFELTPHGRYGTVITGQFTSVIVNGRLGQSQESVS